MSDNTSVTTLSEEVKKADPKSKAVEKIVVYDFGNGSKFTEEDVRGN